MAKGLDPASLVELRKGLDLTQSGMANLLGMSLRAYQDIENGRSEYRIIHRLAAERVALTFAAINRKPMAAPSGVRQDAFHLVDTMRGGELAGGEPKPRKIISGL